MKYRILTDGEYYYVQYRGFMKWVYIEKIIYDVFPYIYGRKTFKTEKEAQQFSDKEWGASGKRVRYTRVI